VAALSRRAQLKQATGNHKFRLHFLLTEWEQVVDAWQLETWDSYRDVLRLGRKTRLQEQQRVTLWSIFARVRAEMASRGMITVSEMFTKLAGAIASSKSPPFDLAVVDEAQDISVYLSTSSWIGSKRKKFPRPGDNERHMKADLI
jgi:hypothetical protein